MPPRIVSPDEGRATGSLAWIGLVIMVASIVWLELLPPRAGENHPLTSRTESSAVFRVVIDPGHGGKDSGAIHAGMLEKDLTLDVAQRLAPLLQAAGFGTMLTRAGDEYVSLGERAATANAQHDCVFVSLHFDEAGHSAATGVSTYYAARQTTSGVMMASWLPFLQRAGAPSPNAQSQSLAAFIQQALVAHTQAVDRGTKEEQFFVTANVRHPAVLIEGGFLTNKDDVQKLSAGEYRQQLAAAIAEGIVHYRTALHEHINASIAAGPITE